jgi:hypothetical protein
MPIDNTLVVFYLTQNANYSINIAQQKTSLMQKISY